MLLDFLNQIPAHSKVTCYRTNGHMPGEFQYQSSKRTGITFTFTGKPYLYLTYCLALEAFYPLDWKINIDSLLTYRYRSKATSYFSSTRYVATSANWAS